MANKNEYQNMDSWINLLSLSIPVKALFTGYILAVGIGLMMAGAQIMLTHGMADGKLGISIDDIVYSYYGNRSGSKLEAKLNGSMKDKATAEENLKIIKWIVNGSDEHAWIKTISPIVESKCSTCHANIATLPNITQYEVIKDLTEIDMGVNVTSLTRVSHIHIFGIAFIFFFV
ncbi:MAG: elongation factor-1 alpha, partial [Candidatus Thioglobus sp.]